MIYNLYISFELKLLCVFIIYLCVYNVHVPGKTKIKDVQKYS